MSLARLSLSSHPWDYIVVLLGVWHVSSMGLPGHRMLVTTVLSICLVSFLTYTRIAGCGLGRHE